MIRTCHLTEYERKVVQGAARETTRMKNALNDPKLVQLVRDERKKLPEEKQSLCIDDVFIQSTALNDLPAFTEYDVDKVQCAGLIVQFEITLEYIDCAEDRVGQSLEDSDIAFWFDFNGDEKVVTNESGSLDVYSPEEKQSSIWAS